MSLSGRALPAAAAVLFGLALFGVYTNIYPITNSNTQSTAQLIIPVLEPGDDEPTVEQSGDDPPTPTLLATPTQYLPPEAMETAPDPWTSERMEVASKEPSAEELKKLDEVAKTDDLLRGAFSYPASRPADPVLPKSESPSWGNTTTTSYQDPAQPVTDPYNGVTAQPASTQTPPPDTSTGTQTSPQAPLDLPADTQTSSQPPPDLPADTQTYSQPPAPPDATTSSNLPADSSPPTQDMADLG
jgi:hypothetical protein